MLDEQNLEISNMAETIVLRSAIPDKEDNLSYNLRDMAAFDLTAFDPKHDDLHKFSRDNVQLLLNRVFQLPLSTDNKTGPMVILPAASENAVTLPRAMSLPKANVATRWEKFSADRGISKKKRSRMVWDETSKDWVPRWGSNWKSPLTAPRTLLRKRVWLNNSSKPSKSCENSATKSKLVAISSPSVSLTSRTSAARMLFTNHCLEPRTVPPQEASLIVKLLMNLLQRRLRRLSFK